MEIYCLLNRIFIITHKLTNSSWNRCLFIYLWFKKRITLAACVEVGDLEIMLSKAWDWAHFTVNRTHLQQILVSHTYLPYNLRYSAFISFKYIIYTRLNSFMNIWSLLRYIKQPCKSKSASKAVILPCFWGYFVSPESDLEDNSLNDFIWVYSTE